MEGDAALRRPLSISYVYLEAFPVNYHGGIIPISAVPPFSDGNAVNCNWPLLASEKMIVKPVKLFLRNLDNLNCTEMHNLTTS